MSLINIEYGSLASSDTMNKNFSYLDNKISESTDSSMSMISSILSNIATINSRINEITEDILDVNKIFSDYKTKSLSLIKQANMSPDWTKLSVINFPYAIMSNGYLLLLPNSNSPVTLTINGKVIQHKRYADRYESVVQMAAIPVQVGDYVECSGEFLAKYFLPAKEISFEEDDI